MNPPERSLLTPLKAVSLKEKSIFAFLVRRWDGRVDVDELFWFVWGRIVQRGGGDGVGDRLCLYYFYFFFFDEEPWTAVLYFYEGTCVSC